jgi:hypothetical protein
MKSWVEVFILTPSMNENIPGAGPAICDDVFGIPSESSVVQHQ